MDPSKTADVLVDDNDFLIEGEQPPEAICSTSSTPPLTHRATQPRSER